MHHCLLKIEENDDFLRRNSPKYSKTLCVDGGMTHIHILKQMQSTDKYKNVSKQLVYKLHDRFSNGLTDSSHRG